MLHSTRAASTNLSGVHRILREVLKLLPDHIVNDRPGRLLTALCMLLGDDDDFASGDDDGDDDDINLDDLDLDDDF